ncbi:carbohydrate ABC transporter permease [Actinoalloteichus hymeniacidonis]|uniref:ABC-type sugar transport system, permease component n=1 Tax=Actinoalloteichus hymeniacidonis TaxID=340345 RepID=A0AAC9HSF3_9PSEU|nr:carbohydrate ABC transporter permease [Actinoalloteichus hymeniacidonis]AOS64777.1 ABC-type sugar transport system, permease component [Actinoalloteichus hymeniacidonis]MBB5907147.1 sorbitol/mannitol transport system permease protein [Actinoalloteichus hymeniacidonis]
MTVTVDDARRVETEPAGPPKRTGRAVRGVLLSALAWILGLAFFFPVLWMVLTGFKTEAEAFQSPPTLFFVPTLEQYAGVFERGVGPYLLNSLWATTASTLLVIVLAVPAAYALSIRPVKKTSDVLFFFISTKMLPAAAVIVPLYVTTQTFGIADNIWTLTVLYTAMNLPIAVWMMRSFLMEVPPEILEAAHVDGATLPQTLRRVLLPVVAPGIAATALICVIFSWNEFFFAVNLTAANAATVPVFLVGFMTSEGLYWAQLSAAATLASLPVVLAGWIAQKQLVRGLSMGAVK